MGESSRETSSTKIASKGSQGQLRGRKLAGQKDGGSLHYAIGAVEDDIVIRQRLLTRTTTTRGEPPLKKLLKKFVLFANEIEKEGDNYGECEKLCKAFLLELGTFEFPLLKTKSVIDASKREQENFKELRNKLDKEISQAAKDIEELKVLLEESKIERQHKEECEVIRRLISAQPARSHTQKAIDDLESEIAILESQNLEALKTLELRKKQFALLLHVVDDLQCAMEVSKPLADDLKSGDDDKIEMEHENLPSLPAILAEPMQID